MRALFFIFFIILTLQAEHVSWFGNFDKAHQKALQQNKMLLVLLIDKECPLCTEAIKTSFINQSYIKIIDENFIAVLVTKGQQNSYPIELLYTITYPALFILDKHELFVCEALRGEMTPDRVKGYLKQCAHLE